MMWWVILYHKEDFIKVTHYPLNFLCVEAWSALLYHGEETKLIQRLKISMPIPSILPLFFAHDYLIFYKAFEEEVNKVKEILKIESIE